MIRFFTLGLAFSLVFLSSCTKDQPKDAAEAAIQEQIDALNQKLAPGTFELSPGVSVVSKEALESGNASDGVDSRANSCVATINVVLGTGSSLLVNGVGGFTGPQNVNISFTIFNGQAFTVAYGGTTGVTVTQLNTGGCVVFSVAPSAIYKVVSSTFRLYCAENLCYDAGTDQPWIIFS